MEEYSDELVISLLFPPNDDTSGITVFKRVMDLKKPVDILQARLKSSVDDELFNRHIKNRIYIDVDCDWDMPSCILKSIESSSELLFNDYKRIYSRSWLMQNHFIALEYKFSHPDVFWSGEFSDPLILNISNKVRTNKKFIIDDEEFISHVNAHINEFNQKNNTSFSLIENKSSMFYLAEYLTYIFADRVIFTNENQRDAMLSQFPVSLKNHVLLKCEILRHPTLDGEFYHIRPYELELDDDCINIAYFGHDYYGQRHFESLFYSVESLNHKFKDKIRIYLFIEDVKLVKRLVKSLDSRDNFIIKKPLEYFEFLNATTKFDILVVNDLITGDDWPQNPYLPSKLSDYLGSKRDIWALCEKGSTLSKFDLKYKSDVRDFDDCLNQLAGILEDYGFDDDDYTVSDDYFLKRLTALNKLFEVEYRRTSKLKDENKSLKRTNKDILSSNSWKLTKPLRNFRNKK